MSEVPRLELETIARAERRKFLRLAVTFGSLDRASREYRSTTAVHLWLIGRLPRTITWRKIFVHVFIHEPLHHAIGRCLAEIGAYGDHEWVIERLGDGRSWWGSRRTRSPAGRTNLSPLPIPMSVREGRTLHTVLSVLLMLARRATISCSR